MCWTQKFSFSRDLVILDLKLQLAKNDFKIIKKYDMHCEKATRKDTNKIAIKKILKEICLTAFQKSFVKIIHTPHFLLKSFLILFIIASS
jgi:hypothetical protein